jgi:hypothetical protein
MNAHSIARLDLVYPELSRRWKVANDMLVTLGFDTIEVVQGVRTWPEQQILWQEGRNPDGSFIDPIHRKGVVTNAKPGESWHNFGLAIDADPFTLTGKPDWDDTHPVWQKMIDVGVSLGLRNGKSWKDEPHFELTGDWGTKPGEEVLYLFREGGLPAVFAEMDKMLGIKSGGQAST